MSAVQKTLYQTDIVSWSDEQAEALRSLARRPELSNMLDWDNVIDEIECVGRTEIRTVESAIRLVLAHLVKIASVPEALAVPHWRTDIVIHADDAREDHRASMSGRMSLARTWRRAKLEAESALLKHGDLLAADLPVDCPFTLHELLDEAFDIDAAVARLTTAPAPH